MPAHEDEQDSWAALEERIQRTVELVAQMRQQKAALEQELETALAAKEDAVREAAEARAQLARTLQEMETLRAERKQVRSRIEKLKDQLELLGG